MNKIVVVKSKHGSKDIFRNVTKVTNFGNTTELEIDGNKGGKGRVVIFNANVLSYLELELPKE